ncbi:MAG: ABC transporter ATP-binding protein [Chitinophagales bacterium]
MKNLYQIFKLIQPWRWSFLFSAILLIVGIFIRMLEPKMFQVAVDYIAPMFIQSGLKSGKTDGVISAVIAFLNSFSDGSLWSMLGLLAFLYILVSLFRAVFVFIANTINASSTEKASQRLRNMFFSHVQHLPMRYFASVSTGELIQRSTGDIETIRRFIGNQMVEVLRLTAIFVFSSYWLFKGNVVFGFISICATPLIAISAILFFNKEQKIWQKHEDEADKLNAITQENIAGIRVVKAFAQEEQEKLKFDQQNQRKLQVALSHAKLHTAFWPLSDLLVHIQIVLSVLFGGYLVLNQAISLGELISYYTYIVMVAWPMRQVGRTLSEMGMALVAMDRIQSVLDVEEEEFASNLKILDKLESIEFQDLWFRYPNEENYAIRNLNLKIIKGESILILGPMGSGKSTLLKLLLRFYEIEKGRILINGLDIAQYDKQDLRSKIGMVLQSAFLFTDTLAGNISYARKTAQEAEIFEVASIAQLKEVEEIFSDGFQTMVGEKGVSLSGGQKQRVSLARTMLQNPEILILDDVTSAVDTETEAEILQEIHKNWRDRTTLMVSHRLTLVPFVDRIVILENGSVSAEGNHEEVLKTNTFYKNIHEVQNILEAEIEVY